MLELEHAQVMVASTVADALEIMSWFDPNVIVSDIMLPDIDGLAFMQQLRSEGNAVPAIAISASVYPQDQQAALEAGYQCFLEKPLDPNTLVFTLQELLCSPQTAGQAIFADADKRVSEA